MLFEFAAFNDKENQVSFDRESKIIHHKQFKYITNALTEGSYFGQIGCILGGIRRAGIIAETPCELQCLSKINLNLLLGQHPEVGEDLKAVDRARMKQV